MKFSFAPNIIEAFTQGDCYRLARSMIRHGYPMVLVGVHAGDPNIGMFWIHALNALPDGRFVDITGIYENTDELMTRWHDDIENVRGFMGLNRSGIVIGDEALDILNDSVVSAFHPHISPARYANSIHKKLTTA